MFYSNLWIFFSVFWIHASGRQGKVCPAEESISPHCGCMNLANGPIMLCSEIKNAEELIPPVEATESLDMHALIIISAVLMYIPSKLFIDTNYAQIYIVNSQIMALSDSDLAFEGLEDTLEELHVGGEYTTTWDWSLLRNHRKLHLIRVYASIFSIDQRFPSLPNLRHLDITHGDISFIHHEAFRGLENLAFITLEHNKIAEMKRGMFTDPANNLYHIDLSNNCLESLPDDMFTSMPRLKELYLKNNKLFTLKEEVYRWPVENLQTLDVSGNAFRCDCRLDWMVKIKKPMFFEGNCTAPAYLKNVPLRNLKSKSLVCWQQIQVN